MSDNRRIVPVGAAVAALTLGAGVFGAVHVATDDPAPSDGRQPAFAVLPPPSAGPLPNAGSTSATKTTTKIRVAAAPITVRYTFDGGVDKPIVDTNGRHPLQPLAQNGGNLALVPEGAGLAVDFPERCTLPRERDCPRAILEGSRDDALNPGTRPLRYGASVRMTREDLADGANVVQKGYSVGGVSQFKLQVDHRQGHPSCVLAGHSRIYRAEPALDIADGTWHNVSCARTGSRLTITVDGVERASVPVPASMSIANAEPLRVGGKGPNKGNDQYAGQVDNVFLAIG
ncbi:LamG-like jellyroll fold domain-containing protein [Jidongwangia harbinensis]|uniref:LamG-like jellyroll fold domain-containing protein n=1 Tax=Jidongwangia harbinensis TaxID=2878561 RepID=UPI001CD95D3F|nr:LamG-like jellyroll fold domain-containing protein [Jidongwangia harbinensis]MCA2212803.1 LamG domain-containing protein [Jidongwangia harbinensis]